MLRSLFVFLCLLLSFTNISSQCSSTITSFPHNESFESNISWLPYSDIYTTTCTTADETWQRRNSSTPSSGTGPTSAQAGSYFVYTEASGSCSNDLYVIESPCYDLSGKNSASIDFYYHMNGTNVGSLHLLISTNNGTTYSSFWSLSGSQGDAWNSISLDLAAYLGSTVMFKFEGTTGSGWSSDIAIDNITVDASGGSSGGNSLWSQNGSNIYYNSGNVGIGTMNPTDLLSVNGKIKAREYEATLTGWSDYVFKDDYELMSLSELEEFINTHDHLPGIPSEKEVLENGVELGEMNAKLLAKIEELTLYVIQLQKELNEMKQKK